MKHFSLERNGVANRAFALLLAVTFAISPLAAAAQEGSEGNLNDMWQEEPRGEEVKPAEAEAEAEKPSKKKKKPKKSKGLTPPVADGDLLKSTDKPASGWDSPSTGSSGTDPSAGDLDLKKSSDVTESGNAKPVSDGSSEPASSTGTPAELGSETQAASTGSNDAVKGTGTAVSTPAISTPAAPSATSKAASVSTPAASKAESSTTAPSTTVRGTAPAVTTQPVTKSTESSPPPVSDSVPAKKATTTATETALSKPDGPLQPLCKLASLTSSDFITSGGWPGVGPFAQEQGDSGAMVDESKNRLKLKLSGEDVTHAELLLVNQSPKPAGLLAIQMNADFLLEAVGALPGKIADFNSDMFKNQEKLSATTPESVSLKAGTYVVQIQRKAAQNATVPGNVSFLIALDNQKPTIVASASTPKTDGTSFSVYSTPSSHDTPTAHDTTSSNPATTKIATTTPATTPATTPVAPKSDDLLHKQFANLINSWQQMKRSAVKTRQAASLSRILGGSALATQNRAIEWLIENKRYYEMTPLELKVQNYKELSPGAKYEIETYIKERRQLVSADTMKVEKDSTQAYNVVYTVEKIRGAWLITDTRMLKP